MWPLVAICGFTAGSVGLLTVGLWPPLRMMTGAYLRRRTEETSEQLADLFIDVPLRRVQVVHVGAPLLGAAVGYLLFRQTPLAAMGLAGGLAVPHLILRLVAWRRRKLFHAQLVNALLILTSSLKAGLSLLQALEVLAEETVPPMSQEVNLAVKETRMGLSLDEALKRLKRRIPHDDVNLVVTTLLVAREMGGDVTRLFNGVINTIRERQQIKEKIKTLTLIPRLQGWIMAVLPFVFAFVALQINPNYFTPLLHDATGQLIAMVAATLWGLSLIMIWWFSRAMNT